jgi:hypothetical protein
MVALRHRSKRRLSTKNQKSGSIEWVSRKRILQIKGAALAIALDERRILRFRDAMGAEAVTMTVLNGTAVGLAS